MMDKETIIAGIDIGTSKVCCVIFEYHKSEYQPIGYGLCQSAGFKKGVVTEVKSLSSAIKKAVINAQEMAGKEIDTVILNITGQNLRSFNVKQALSLGDFSGKTIKRRHVEQLLINAQNVDKNSDEEVIQVIKNDFILDGERGVVSPLSMVGDTLELDTHVIVGKNNVIYNLVNAVEEASLGVSDIYVSSCLSAESILAKEEKELGVVLVDIGAGTADIMAYIDNRIVFSHVVALGGDNITSEIAEKLRLPIEKANDIKAMYGFIGERVPGYEEEIFVPNLSGKGFHKIMSQEIAQAMDPCVVQILTQIKESLDTAGISEKLAGGVVFTGGTSLLRGFVSRAKEILKMPVRIGNVNQKIFGNNDLYLKGPQFSTVLGIGLIASQPDSERFNNMVPNSSAYQLLDRFKRFMSDLF